MKEHYIKNARKYQGQQLVENLLILDAFDQRQAKNQAEYQLVGIRLI